MMTEYWIWNNRQRGWRSQKQGYTLELHLAARFAEHIAMQYVKTANKAIGPNDYPLAVMVEVNNTFLSSEAQRVLLEFEATGDRSVIDHAYFQAADRVLRKDPTFTESYNQMLHGEGQRIDLDAMIDNRKD